MKEKYIQIKLGKYIIRFFYKKDEMLYKWHKDDEDREVYFFPIGKWYLQFDEELPEKLIFGEWYMIYKKDWHRLIRKSGFLLAIIKQY